MKIALTSCVLLLLGAGAWIIALQKELSHFQGRLTYSEYDPVRSMLVTRWKADDRIIEAWFDENDDLEWDSLVLFSKDQHPANIWVDEDHNGIFEVSYALDRSGSLIARYEDIGQDGWWEEYVRYTGDSMFVYRDENGDGHYADNEMIRRQASDDR